MKTLQDNLPQIVETIFSSYQKARADEQLNLKPFDSSLAKWKVVLEGAKVLGKESFSFIDFGAHFGLFSILLCREFKKSRGVINNINQLEIATNRYLVDILGLKKRLKIQDCPWDKARGKYDFAIMVSLIHHLAMRGLSIEKFAAVIDSKIKPEGILVLEVPTKNDFAGKDLDLKSEDFAKALKNYSLAKEMKVEYPDSAIDRIALIFRKKKRRFLF